MTLDAVFPAKSLSAKKNAIAVVTDFSTSFCENGVVGKTSYRHDSNFIIFRSGKGSINSNKKDFANIVAHKE